MVSRKVIDEFIAQRTLAVVGVSRSGRGFGAILVKELTRRGTTVRLVHHEVDELQGQACARRLADVAGEVGGVVLVTAPAVTERLVAEAAEAGVRRLWLQQGAESPAAIRLAEEKGLAVVHHECLLMFLEPCGFPHGFHRWIRKVTGRLPT